MKRLADTKAEEHTVRRSLYFCCSLLLLLLLVALLRFDGFALPAVWPTEPLWYKTVHNETL